MSNQATESLQSFCEWIRTTDDHAAHRLRLADQAAALLSGQPSDDLRSRRESADKLERWRYQLLKEHDGRLAPQDLQLSECLDLTANRLRGFPQRAPRRARTAVEDEHAQSARAAQVAEAIDPALPLTELARLAARVTEDHFASSSPSSALPPGSELGRAGRRMFLYAPLYLSNYCVNHCTYCGFRYPQDTERRQLDVDEAMVEAEVLIDRGFRHLLLLGGDFPQRTTTRYYAKLVRKLVRRGVAPAVEIAPQSTWAYHDLVEAGLCGVTLYQETYAADSYRRHHPRGPKASYDWRLEGPERAAEAGVGRLGLGILLGLATPEDDLLALVRHAEYLQQRFPDCRLAFSLPRIHRAPESFALSCLVDDEKLVRFYAALRLAFPEAELVLSTREKPATRNRLAQICVTQMSAGSCTAPGGYASAESVSLAGEQFPVCDERSPAEVAAWLHRTGFVVRWELPN